ncbi:intracellular protein transport protein (Sat1) [Purpureocillium lavendulum]|uniref:Intracellular protein transport protein (Sat1) n=1 Tax=Purpureocillium lavendulum TaxID=1247861 RepID=A0AB34FK93_9HYPO|nr:intracellular protein transport protein (Sat1) [Purpureocillium lavendulum]
MAPDGPSNIRVFVHWAEQTVFAGEDVKCTVTFKNVAPDQSSQQQRQQQQQQTHAKQHGERHRNGRAKAAASLTSPPPANSGRGHRRSALSLSIPGAGSHSRSGSIQWPHTASSADWRPGHSHKRSLSIVSIGSASTVDDHAPRTENHSFPQRPRRSHNRAASLQISPRGQPVPPGPHSEFRFPAAAPPENESQPSPRKAPVDGLLNPKSGTGDHNNLAVRSKDQPPSAVDRPAARILSSTSIPGGTPRSSGEFYSMSNNSSETLASEYVTHPLTRGHGKSPQLRRSIGVIQQQSRAPELLMMGYAQIQGSFMLDGSLVSLGPFEQVKKKAAVGGRGGGVIGLESPRRESGLLRGFGWGNISNSLGDFLGSGELSTIKEMRGVANSKSVPLLSTPQSILFVDLQLSPGESRSFEYKFKLPKGLPPTHKGKAVKISYSLVIGTQRVGGAKEQQVRSVEIPFRVLGSVNSYGEILGHDLMSPYILLRDEAMVKTLGKGKKAHSDRRPSDSPATMNDFLAYVDELATRPRDVAGGTLLSPTESQGARRQSSFEDATSAKEAIHLAIMRSNQAGEGQQSPNRFEIARNGQRVGVVMLTRPAYRLGEVITMAIDFTDADIPCYAVHATLETSEKVDSSLALRSESSIHRVTRKVYVASSEAALYSRRVVFTPTIPISATPEFVTSGVSFEWTIRVEFVVPYQGTQGPDTGEPRTAHPLLEQISQDEKGGLVLVAMENLACESFDVSVPLRVYGAVGSGLERLERDEAAEEGLAV